MKLLAKRFLSFFPTDLPVGMAEFDRFADSIIELAGEFADRDSMTFAIASMVMHLGPQKSRAPKNFFVQSLRKTAANQIAGQVFLNIKEKQKAAQEAATKNDNEKDEKTGSAEPTRAN